VPMTAQDIKRDPWNAVTLPLPDDASLDLLNIVACIVARLLEQKREAIYAALYEGGPEAGVVGIAILTRLEQRQQEAESRLAQAG